MRQGAGDGTRIVRADLCRRLDALEATLARRGPIGLGVAASEIAAIASEYGFQSAVRLAEGLAVALGEGGRGVAVAPWVERLRDAIGCEAEVKDSETTWLASVMVRLAG